MSEKLSSRQNKQPNYRLRRAVVGAVGVAGLLAAGGAVNSALDGRSEGHFERIEQEAIKEADKAMNAVVVVREGAVIRTAPHTVNGNPEMGPDTVARRVGEGQVLRIDRPVIYDAPDETRWLGFSQRPVAEDANTSDPEQVFWVNYTELNRQSQDGRNYIDVFDYPYVTEALRSGDASVLILEAGIDGHGNFVAGNGQKGGAAATASEMPAHVFDQMVDNEQLARR
jgi:hypothetical protein